MSWVNVTEALGTVSATGVALLFGISAEVRAAKLQKEARTERQFHQASRVTAWAEMTYEDLSGATPYRIDAILTNGSDNAIWDINLRIPSVNFTADLPYLAPGGMRQIEVHGAPPDLRVAVETTFRDSENRVWKRDHNGVLALIGKALVDQLPLTRGWHVDIDGKKIRRSKR